MTKPGTDQRDYDTYPDSLLQQITDTIEQYHLKDFGNTTETAKRYGLTRNQLVALTVNHPAVGDAYKRAREHLVDRCEQTFFRCGAGELRGVNTQATGRILQALRGETWNPATKVDVSGGYGAAPLEEKLADQQGDQPGELRIVAGGRAVAQAGGSEGEGDQ